MCGSEGGGLASNEDRVDPRAELGKSVASCGTLIEAGGNTGRREDGGGVSGTRSRRGDRVTTADCDPIAMPLSGELFPALDEGLEVAGIRVGEGWEGFTELWSACPGLCMWWTRARQIRSQLFNNSGGGQLI